MVGLGNPALSTSRRNSRSSESQLWKVDGFELVTRMDDVARSGEVATATHDEMEWPAQAVAVKSVQCCNGRASSPTVGSDAIDERAEFMETIGREAAQVSASKHLVELTGEIRRKTANRGQPPDSTVTSPAPQPQHNVPPTSARHPPRSLYKQKTTSHSLREENKTSMAELDCWCSRVNCQGTSGVTAVAETSSVGPAIVVDDPSQTTVAPM